MIPHTLTKKPTTVEKKPHKTAKAKLVEESTSDDEDEPVSFFTFNDKSESTIDDNEETFQSHIPESHRTVSTPLLESKHPAVASSSHVEMLSSASTSLSSGKHVAVAPSPEIAEPITQAAVVSEETPSHQELETRTYYYEQQTGQNQQYGGYSSEHYVSASMFQRSIDLRVTSFSVTDYELIWFLQVQMAYSIIHVTTLNV